jgi:hypothetical protein
MDIGSPGRHLVDRLLARLPEVLAFEILSSSTDDYA